MTRGGLVLGVGIDLVQISRIRDMKEKIKPRFVAETYTAAEQAEAAASSALYRDTYLAGRFAVKEAVYKALAHLTEAGTFDLRQVETLRQPDGCPKVTIGGKIAELLGEIGADDILVSITNEGEYAMAIAEVVCRGKEQA